MILSLLVGLILGFVLAMPPGPVAVSAMRLGLDKGLRHGTLFSIGTGLMDFFFCIFAVFTTSAALALIGDFSEKYPHIVLLLQILVVIGLFVYGIFTIKTHKNPITIDGTKSTSKFSKIIDMLAQKGPFFLGIAIAFTNIANPTFLPSLAYIALTVNKMGLIEGASFGNILFSIGFGFGNFLWLYTLVRVLIYYKPRMSEAFLIKIRQFAGFTLIGVGTLLGYRIFEITKWSDILKLIFAF